MNGKRDKGPAGNPWVRKTDSAEDEAVAPEPELPPSPWSLEVPPRPSPWTDSGTPGAGGGPGPTGGPGESAAPGGPGVPPGPSAPGPGGGGPGPARETSSAWGEKVGPPSLRRPEPAKKKPKVPPLLIPIGAGIAVVALVAVALVLLTGGYDSAKPPPTGPSTSVPVTTPTPSTYTPPPNAIAVAFGVSVVPVEGWSVLASETEGKQLFTYAPNREPRAFFWVRQKQNVSAQEYMLRIVEGETKGEIVQMGNSRNLACPRDVLVECVAITYTSTAKGVKVQGFVETYRRKDGLVTALDFRTRVDFAPKAEADAETMKKSVIDSL